MCEFVDLCTWKSRCVQCNAEVPGLCTSMQLLYGLRVALFWRQGLSVSSSLA